MLKMGQKLEQSLKKTKRARFPCPILLLFQEQLDVLASFR